VLKESRVFAGLLLVVIIAAVSIGFYLYSVRGDEMDDYTRMPDTSKPPVDTNVPEKLETATFALG
jgi:hypothetical protein